MRKTRLISTALTIMLLFAFTAAYACSTIIVGKDATADGSVIVSHSDDNELQDQRLIYVPAMDHKPGSKRPVYYDPTCFEGSSVRYVGSSRGPGYVDPSKPATKPIGYIDQVPHTYAYFDSEYGVMNEKQLMFGECTNGAKYETKPVPGKLIFYSSELSRVALERCDNARDAVKLMGKLIDKHGYYGTGETLLVGGKKEAWVFEMCASPDGKGGLWVAKRVPDDEMFAAANEFRIREITPGSPDLLYSKRLFEVTKKAGWYDPKKGKMDWLETVSHGEYNHPYYSLRRIWSIFRRAKPSANFSPWVKDGYTKEYPFSIKPDKKLSVRDVIALHRDHYEGTEFDMRKGLAAGPFGSPNRFIGKYDGNQNNVSKGDRKMWGTWERPISVFYCGFIWVNQARSWMPDDVGGICWFGYDRPYETVFVPFYVGITGLPEMYSKGTTDEFSTEFAWWAFDFISNYADLKYSYMIKDIQKKQKMLEDREFEMQAQVEKKALELYKKDPKEARKYLTKYCENNAEKVVGEWWKLAHYLVQKYSDGYVNKPKRATEVGYPKWWLKATGYDKGPIRYEKPADMK